jgi:hypothetical protein
MKALFTTLLLIIIVYYFIKAIYRLVSVFFNTSHPGNNSHRSKNRKGDVTIDYQEKQKKRFDKDKGEYIEYEEIKK